MLFVRLNCVGALLLIHVRIMNEREFFRYKKIFKPIKMHFRSNGGAPELVRTDIASAAGQYFITFSIFSYIFGP